MSAYFLFYVANWKRKRKKRRFALEQAVLDPLF